MDGLFPQLDIMPAQRYEAEMAAWRADPQAYWMKAAREIDWMTPPDTAFQLRQDGHADWFPGGVLNSCANALDRHVAAGHGTRTALIWDSPSSGAQETFSYDVLLDRVARFAGGLRALGVEKGDRVLIYMPPVPEAVIAMLACARLGAVHVVVFAGYAPVELARRIDDVAPRFIIAASCGYVMKRVKPLLPDLDSALALSESSEIPCVIFNRAVCPVELKPCRDHDFLATEQAAPVAPEPVLANDPLYILHTSGTTGRPKGIVRDNGGHAVALHRSMAMVYGVGAGDVFCTTADLGWVVGHSYAVYGPLFAGCTTVLFEGCPTGTPDAGAMWRVCAEHKVRTLFTSPSVLRAMRQEDPQGSLVQSHDLSQLQAVFLAGERTDPETVNWGARTSGVKVLDHWWQTETGWAVTGHFLGLSDTPELYQKMRTAPGFDLCVLNNAGDPAEPGEIGELALRLPLPPGCLMGLWNGIDRNYNAYAQDFPGYYRTFDLGVKEASGAVRLISRVDDVLKVAGRRIAAGSIEEVLSLHPDVVECAVVGVPDLLRGEVPKAFVILRQGAADEAGIRSQLIRLVRENIGGFTGFKKVEFLLSLPRTKSGKITRNALKEQPV